MKLPEKRKMWMENSVKAWAVINIKIITLTPPDLPINSNKQPYSKMDGWSVQ